MWKSGRAHVRWTWCVSFLYRRNVNMVHNIWLVQNMSKETLTASILSSPVFVRLLVQHVLYNRLMHFTLSRLRTWWRRGQSFWMTSPRCRTSWLPCDPTPCGRRRLSNCSAPCRETRGPSSNGQNIQFSQEMVLDLTSVCSSTKHLNVKHVLSKPSLSKSYLEVVTRSSLEL